MFDVATHGISHFRILSLLHTRFIRSFIDLAALPQANGDSGKLERVERNEGSYSYSCSPLTSHSMA